MEYRGHHLFQQVSVSKIYAALQYLKATNPHFKDINLDLYQLHTDDADEASILKADEPDQFATDIGHTAGNEVTIADEQQTTTASEIIHSQDESSHELHSKNIATETDNTTSDLHDSSTPMVSCLQPEDLANEICNNVVGSLYSVAPAEGNRPSSVFDMEMKAFPYLFPEGKNGFQEQRHHKLGLSRYFNSRLFNVDARFASDPQHIFFSQYANELNQITNSISIAMRKTTGKGRDGKEITAAMLTDAVKRKEIIKSNEGYHFLKTVRGTPAYWEKTLRDLFAMVKQLGTPTWFCSFSAADRWPEIVKAICRQGKDPPPDMDWSTYSKLINSNPVTACRMFEHRVQSFISNIILSSACPIGNVVDYFYRTEFQSRGWPHIHCLFWCQNAPKFTPGDPNNKDFIEYIDQYVTCAVPDEELPLHDIVTSVQMHSKSHSPSCKKGSKQCRFHFPKPPSGRTFIAMPTPPPDNLSLSTYQQNAKHILTTVWDALDNADTSCLSTIEELLETISISQEEYEHAHAALAKRNTVIFKRQLSERWVNPYNRHLLQAWNGNMDIQPVLDAYSCIMYIVSYISKAEREIGDLLKTARKLGNVYLHSRDISIMEAIYRVTGMKLKQCTRDVLFVPTDPDATRITKPLKVLMAQQHNNETVWLTSILERYHARPLTPEFDDMSLASFASKFKVVYHAKASSAAENNSDSEEEANTEHVYELQRGLGTIVKKKKPAIVRYARFNKEKDSERYYCNLIRMYYPHRTEDMKSADIPTYEEMFLKYSDIILPNIAIYEKLTEELDEAWNRLQQGETPEDAWANIAPNQELERAEQEQELNILRQIQEDCEEINAEDIPELQSNHETGNAHSCSHSVAQTHERSTFTIDHRNHLRSLNAKQSELFYYIRSWALKKAHCENIPPFHIFLTGGAGTGKSHLIKCIYDEFNKAIHRQDDDPDLPVILLVAYTGTAAFNIGGQTIHSSLCINKGMSKCLNENQANTLRYKLQNLQLLIIDEVSMVSTKLLELIHCRLQQIKQPTSQSACFGNISILAVGDFYQVPPVAAKQLFSNADSLTDLWTVFHIWQLDEVLRQKGDFQLISMLNRLRTRKKHEPLYPEDEQRLRSRLITRDHVDYPKSAIHIAPTHRQLDCHNNDMLQHFAEKYTIVTIKAVDICLEQKRQKTYKRKEPIQSKDASLPACISLCMHARVMLTTNVDVLDGLTNGAMGTVTAILQGTQPLGQPEAICVLFDHINVGANARHTNPPPSTVDQNSTVIKAHKEIVQRQPFQITRHQYPFLLCWGVTIHKLQGMTTKEAVISLKHIFKPGMAYVALSRVTSTRGLFLIEDDFDPDAIYSDPKVHQALVSMPAASTLSGWKQTLPTVALSCKPNEILIASHNVEGLLVHRTDCVQNKFLAAADIVALQETWLQPDDMLNSLLPCHEVVLCSRNSQYNNVPNIPEGLHQNGRGGVALLIHRDFSYQHIETSHLGLECVAVMLKSPPLSIVNVYRPPSLPLSYFCSRLNHLLKTVSTSSMVITGDFNIDLLKHSSSELTKTLQIFKQVIVSPTTKKQTLLDHIYITGVNSINCGVVPVYYGYHDITYAVIQ